MKLFGTSSAIAARTLDELRAEEGSTSLGRVLTLIAVVRDEQGLATAKEAAAGAARAHPARIIILHPDNPKNCSPEPLGENAAQLDAELIVGGEAGMAEIVILKPYCGAGSNLASLVMPLLLPDAPTITWWVQEAPSAPSKTDLGKVSTRRITTSNNTRNPVAALTALAATYADGDTDLAWAATTLWRGHLAAMLDEPPHEPVRRVEVTGNLVRGGVNMLAAWLRLRLGVPVEILEGPGSGIDAVRIIRDSGSFELARPTHEAIGTLSRDGREDVQVRLPMRSFEAMLIEELRTLGADHEYADVLANGLSMLF